MTGGRWRSALAGRGWPPVAFVALVALLALEAIAAARPGGGHSYSGGGRSGGYSGGGGGWGGGGGGGGGDGGEALLAFIRLLVAAPHIGFPVLAVVIAFVIFSKRAELRTDNLDIGGLSGYVPSPARVPASFDPVRDEDPEFSRVLFEDFCYALYARLHLARGRPQALEELSPYVSPAARTTVARLAPGTTPVAVIVGAMRVDAVHRERPVPWPPGQHSGQDMFRVTVTFEANLAFTAPRAMTLFVRERWILSRAPGVKTRPWRGTRTFDCPNCAAVFEPGEGNRCSYCGEIVDNGAFDWVVTSLKVLESSQRRPSLTGTVPEVGTDDKTVFQPQVAARWNRLVGDDPALTAEALGTRLRLIYDELNAAWSANDLTRARPYLSDGMCHYLRYWIDQYRLQGLRNELREMRLTSWTIVKIERDKHYDAITVRLWATGYDTTVEVASGRVVGGNPSRERAYSEYWTLVRGAGVRGAPRVDKRCPNCSADLRINMGGACEYCGAHVTSGEFDWVLSRIEQDEAYVG